MQRIIYQPQLTDFLHAQLSVWQEANERYAKVVASERKRLDIDGFPVMLQHNPARIVSTAAKTDARSISQRKCFLCRENRPKIQDVIEIADGWDLLVNPFPIFPFHFTIASRVHTPQDHIPAEMAAFAERLPGMAVFYNGAKAGASAPDHLHCQAVPREELPLIAFTEANHKSDMSAISWSTEFEGKAPFCYLSGIVRNDANGLRVLNAMLHVTGAPSETAPADPGLVNAIFWIDADGTLRIIVIPRRAHRPSAYFKEGSGKITVSPGAIDMAGVIITPVEADFHKLNANDIAGIYAETAYADLPPENCTI